ncbi:MAG TPA: BlaI/MecI/CopY family transcriptional regulator [Caulobacteraceae bacterium]
MAVKKLATLELKVMNVLWARGASSVREVQELIPGEPQPAYTTIQTTLYRLERKKAVRRTGRAGNAHIFKAVISEASAQHSLIDDLLGLLGGRAEPLMAHLIDTGKLSLEDVREAERRLLELEEKAKRR